LGWGRASNLQRVSPKYRVGAKWNRNERVGFDGANEAREMTPGGSAMFRYGATPLGEGVSALAGGFFDSWQKVRDRLARRSVASKAQTSEPR